jgi:hypothetical protein
MFMDYPIETPFSETRGRHRFRSLRPLRVGQKHCSGLAAEIPDDDTVGDVLEVR